MASSTTKPTPLNKTGYQGVSYNKERKVYRAVGHINKKQIHLGYFEDVHDAGVAACDWRLQNAEAIAEAHNAAVRRRISSFKKKNARSRD